MSIPTFRVEVAFASEPLAETYDWTDISSDVGMFEYSRGRTYDFERVEAARGTCELLDDLSAYDPRNAGTLINHVPNPSIESAATGYVNEDNVTVARTTGEAMFGSGSLQVTATTAVPGRSPIIGIRDMSGNRIAATASVPWAFSAYVKMRSNYGVRLARLRWIAYDAGGSQVGGGDVQSGTTALTTSYQRITLTATPPATTTTLRILAYCDTSASVAGEIYDWDGFQLEQASAVSEYTDGSLDNCRWSGTAHESSSYRGGPHYPNVKAMKAVRQVATLDAVDYPCALLYVEGWPRQRAGNMATRRLRLVDAFDFMATAGLAGQSFSAELTGTRVENVLDAIGWPAALRSISAGLDTVEAVTFAAGDTTKALTHLQQMAEDEDGIFFIDRRGYATFIDRQDLLGAPFNESIATFSENPGVGEFLCSITVADFDKKTIQNDLTGTRQGGTAQTAEDAASIAAYGRRSRQYTSLLSDDATQLAAMQYKLAKYKEPLQRIEQIEVLPGSDSDLWEVMLGLDVGDRITVIDSPPDADEQEDEYIVQRVQFRRAKGSDAGHRFVLSLWPADINNWFVLDDPLFGVLDSNKLGR